MAAGSLIPRVTFAGGQAGRGMRGRSDTARYQISVELMENYCTMVEGGATRAPGTIMVLKLKNETRPGRLLPFRYKSDDYFMLVVNGGKARFVRQGGVLQNDDTTPYEMTVPFTDADAAIEAALLKRLRAATIASANKMFIASGTIKPQEITRRDTRDWICENYVATGGPVDTQNLDTAKTIIVDKILPGEVAALTGVGTAFVAGQIGAVYRLDEHDLSVVAGWTSLEAGIAAGAQRRWKGNVYVTTAGGSAGAVPPEHTEGSVSAGSGFVIWTYLHSGHGFLRIETVTDATHATGTVLTRLPDSVKTTATYRWSPPAWSEAAGYPKVVMFNSPSLAWYRGDLMWLSGADEHDLTVTRLDDGAIAERLKSPDASLPEIMWAAPSGALIIGTSDLEWSVRGANVFDALTADNIRAIPESTEGSVEQVPTRVDGGVMFVGKSGKRLHYGRYDRQQQIFDPEEVSIWARDIFGRAIVKTAWQRDPHRILWIILDDGSLVSFTFMPKQQIAAFALHPRTNAFFEDVEAIPSTASGVDEVYFIVKRTIDGDTHRYVEQLGPFFTPLDPQAPTAEGAWFLDCALRYQGVPIKTITTLEHLEGQTVGVFADGCMQKPKVVVDGTITLDRKASDILVGIPLVARLKDLPRNLSTQAGPSDGLVKSVHEALFILDFSAGGMVSVNEGPPEPLLPTGKVRAGEPIPLFSGRTRPLVEGNPDTEVALDLVNDDAMPFTVLAMSPRVQVEEDA